MNQDNSKKPRIFIDKEGNWFQDGIPIAHRWTYLYNNTLLDRDDEGHYFIDEGRGKVYIEAEDTPFVIKNIELRKDGLFLILNDETEEKLASDTIYLNPSNIPYVKVKDGRFDARFCRAAYYEIMKLLEKEDNQYYLDTGSEKIKVLHK
ncbi:MAG: DUF1285 domain-containing protein [Candidatus Dadabacteria bacterium]|nr:DUF1285 domain-containing protein [Candidatus Dadabacteria bacterium]NIS07236.1 DUF1285 domain-containing protein [Candidatus Dadabacteria bacterium]NIV40943.1 DUF1285 domain-containing protein [Candidatus Dadabacteria bacterium]NIX14375.1 DUF1285 domain-containing protein [Candidatus Dadabacteria bacterium]NIY20893.1 DUF1285 domain-containing protein [Candidatus Dadabacteria bacterium]